MTETKSDGVVVIAEIVSPDWRATDIDIEAIVNAAARAALDCADAPLSAGAEMGVRLTDDAEIRTLNRDWRDRDSATNVLAFALGEAPAVNGSGTAMLGDVVVAYETCAAEAVDQDKPLANHLSHLVVHGTLHLLGFDHEDDADAEAMEALERVVLARLGIPDPYLGSEAA